MRGLKFHREYTIPRFLDVASYADAWIEIAYVLSNRYFLRYVASYADAWIEMYAADREVSSYAKSHPTRMRGLKLVSLINPPKDVGRILRGCVD